MRHPAPASFFLEVPGGQRFCVHHASATATPRGVALFVHAFAEEMNKSRRMAALQARALAGAGFEVLQIDLLGCGDSSGDFGDASWSAWRDDVHAGARWLAARRPGAPLWLWGLRAGCLLATDAAREHGLHCNFLFWQPSSSGRQALQQFLRLRLAADMIDGQSGGLMESLKQRLADGEPVDVAGYTLPPALAQGLAQAGLTPPAQPGAAVFVEVGTQADAGPSPALAAAAQRWSDAGARVHACAVTGPSFWQTTEIEDAPALLPATVDALLAHAA